MGPVRDTRYQNAPIAEAVVEIRVTRTPAVTLQDLEPLGDGLADSYPRRERVVAVQGMLSMGGTVGAAAHQAVLGCRFVSSDGPNILQARVDSFVFSRLRPYDHWQPFRNEARRLWLLYRSRVGNSTVTRVGVRYVNRIDLPTPLKLETYFRTYPQISPVMPEALSGFFMQLTIPQTDPACELSLHQAAVPSERDGHVGLILDIDVFVARDVPASEDGLWDMLEKLRHKENDVFEACITDRLRELID
ncbi:MAG: TIGR04255 family protein [Candidatus Latescibacterota bacterium]